MSGPSDEEIYAALTEIFHEVFDDDTIVLGPDTSADDIEEWDSFNHVNILVATEQRFGITIDTAQVETMKNVGDFVALIAAKAG